VLVRRTTVVTILTALVSLYAAFAVAEDAAPAAAPAAGAAAAPPVQLPPWMTPDVLKAAVAMNMTDEQKPKFNQAVGDYVTAHFAMIQKVTKAGAPNLDMTIRSKDGALVRQMDDEVHKILTPEQLPAYDNYKKALHSALTPH